MGSCTVTVKCRKNFNILFTSIICDFFIYYPGTLSFPRVNMFREHLNEVHGLVSQRNTKDAQAIFLTYHYTFTDIKIFKGIAFRLRFYAISRWTCRIKISVWFEVSHILNICKNSISFVTIYEIYILITPVDVFSSFNFLSKNFEFLSEIFSPASPILYLYVHVFIYFLYTRLIIRLRIQRGW